MYVHTKMHKHLHLKFKINYYKKYLKKSSKIQNLIFKKIHVGMLFVSFRFFIFNKMYLKI